MGGSEPKAEDGGNGNDGKTPPPKESARLEFFKAAVKQVVGVVFTGAGLLGFVAFSGAVIIWTRFAAIEVPADQAVKAVPRDELVATGSSLLLIFGLFGLLAVLATYLVDRGGRATPGMSRLLLALVAVEGVTTIAVSEVLSLRTVLISIGFVGLVAVAVLSTFSTKFARYRDDLKAREGETEEPRRGSDWVFDRNGKARFDARWPLGVLCALTAVCSLVAVLVLGDPGGAVTRLIWAVVIVLSLGAIVAFVVLNRKIEREEREEKKEREQAEVEDEHPPPNSDPESSDEVKRLAKPRPHLLELRPMGVGLLSALALISIVAPAATLGSWWVAVSFAAAFLIAVGVWRVAVLSKEGYFWFGLVVFLSVPLFGTLALMARNVEDPQVQPVAMIRVSDGPGEAIQGLYVTEADDRVYFANVGTEGCGDEVRGDSGRLLWVPKDEVAAMSIGPLQSVGDAGRAALEMSNALTPDIETSAGQTVSFEAAKEAEREAAEEDDDQVRLESAGPAVRPEFGRGLSLHPEVASPGDPVELRMDEPANGGFGVGPAGKSLRLNGAPLEIVERKEGGKRRPDWRAERVVFRVPAGAESGVVTIGCGQLAGQPYLSVQNAPEARVTVRMQAGSRRVVFDAGGSSDDGGELTRRWTVAGLRMGDRAKLPVDLPPRLSPYPIKLTVTDSDRETDTVEVRLLRLPESRFPSGADEVPGRVARDRLKQVRKTIREAMKARPRPVAIEIHGHADAVGDESLNRALSARRAWWLRQQVFDADRGTAAGGGSGSPSSSVGAAVPLTVRAFGESCPIVRTPDSHAANRRVEVFLLGKGATVGVPGGCAAARIWRGRW